MTVGPIQLLISFYQRAPCLKPSHIALFSYFQKPSSVSSIKIVNDKAKCYEHYLMTNFKVWSTINCDNLALWISSAPSILQPGFESQLTIYALFHNLTYASICHFLIKSERPQLVHNKQKSLMYHYFGRKEIWTMLKTCAGPHLDVYIQGGSN